MKLKETDANVNLVIKKIDSEDGNLVKRLSSIGLIEGTEIQVVKNDKKMPVLIYSRETLLALNKKDAEKIEVEEV
ncbi:MAG: ferrous iron transport protein A [Sphaerochaetaceae bacterium]|nr:ferrous iron transport protein A [Sphaerochaetaceae bacterium]